MEEDKAERMDTPDENMMTPKKMLEKIAELDYNQSHLRELNAEMRHWLDAADDELSALRSENSALRKQIQALEKIITEAKELEEEPCASDLADDLDVQRCTDKIQKLEEGSAMLKEQNKKLTTELMSLQEERDQDKISLSLIRDALQTLELEINEARLGLQQKDEVILQKDKRLKQSEDVVEECFSFMDDLRRTNRELRKQLEDRQDEASFAMLNDVANEKESSISPHPSFAEEMKQLASSSEVNISVSESADCTHEETDDDDELLESPSPLLDSKTPRCSGIKITFQRGRLFLVFLILLAFCASGGCAGIFVSIAQIWKSLNLVLQSFCNVQYNTLPPI